MPLCLARPPIEAKTGPLSPHRVEISTGRCDTSIFGKVAVSSGNAWRGMRLDEVTLAPAEQREGYLDYHVVMVHVGDPVDMESACSTDAGTPHHLVPGAVTIFPAWTPYKTRWDRPLGYVCVRLAPEFVAAANEEVSPRPFQHTVGAADNLVPSLVMALHKEARTAEPAASLYAEALGTALVAHLGRKYASGFRTEARFRGGLPLQRLRRVQEYIETNLATELHLPDLARVAEVSVRHFVRAFKQSTGVSPHQFLLARRIVRGKALLANQQLSIADVALRCGFGSQSRFAAAFRRATDLAPTAYRKLDLPR